VSDSRREILERLRAVPIDAPPLPDLSEPWQRFDDLRTKFSEMVAVVGGSVVPIPDRVELDRTVRQTDVHQRAKIVCSTIPGVGRRDVELAAVDDPHALSDVSLAIVEAELGVAENGAVWVTDAGLRHRAILFIAEHLAVVLEATRLVATLHEAYARVTVGAGFGLFLSGPSKTADIEQSLVIGAHGARSLTVFLVG
jgi:L-lactate dehydrogenase complex protein LldG